MLLWRRNLKKRILNDNRDNRDNLFFVCCEGNPYSKICLLSNAHNVKYF